MKIKTNPAVNAVVRKVKDYPISSWYLLYIAIMVTVLFMLEVCRAGH